MNTTILENNMTIEEDSSFSFDGYQVVRGEFFAHVYEPSFTFNNYKVSVNTACVKKLPDIEYVQILVNPEDKKLAVRPCSEDEKDAFRWCSATKHTPKQITARMFSAKVFSLMDWNPAYRYKLLGKLIRSGSNLLFVFDLKTPEIFTRVLKDDGKIINSRTPTYPEQWKNQFGLPVEEHKKSIQVNIFDGHAVFGLEKLSIPAITPSTRKTSETNQEDEQYEQLSLNTTVSEKNNAASIGSGSEIPQNPNPPIYSSPAG